MPTRRTTKHSLGFTIVELLVVVVVIGVLATMVIVSYINISRRATVASVQSDLDNAAKLLKMDLVESDEFPSSLALANGGNGISASSGTTLHYDADNSTSPRSFCITAVNGDVKYKTTNNSAPEEGVCLKYDEVIELDAGNPDSYPGSGTTWTDLSGNGNNATLSNGVGYSTNSGGTMVFDGIDDYGTIVNNSSLDFSEAQTLIMVMKHTYTVGRRNPWNQAYGGYGTWTHEQGNSISQYLGDSGINNSPYIGVSSPATPRDVWNIMGAVRDTSTMKWYMNGTLRSTTNHSYGTLTATAANISIGNGYAGYWQGEMAVVIAYKRALTNSEMQQIYNNLQARFGL